MRVKRQWRHQASLRLQQTLLWRTNVNDVTKRHCDCTKRHCDVQTSETSTNGAVTSCTTGQGRLYSCQDLALIIGTSKSTAGDCPQQIFLVLDVSVVWKVIIHIPPSYHHWRRILRSKHNCGATDLYVPNVDSDRRFSRFQPSLWVYGSLGSNHHWFYGSLGSNHHCGSTEL